MVLDFISGFVSDYQFIMATEHIVGRFFCRQTILEDISAMENKKERVKIPRVKPTERTTESLGCACPHGIPENRFPCMGNCFRQSTATPGRDCEAICPHCGIWTSLPEGTALKVTRIFDCALVGYGKRITKEDR